jgi:hypothetical protein
MFDRYPVKAGRAESRKFDSAFVAVETSLCCGMAK